MRDRKYKSDEIWEQGYSRKTKPKNPHYKFAKGGQIKESDFEPAKKFNGVEYFTHGPDDDMKPLFNKTEINLLTNGYRIENEYRAKRRTEDEVKGYMKDIKGKKELTFSDNEYGGNWRIWLKKTFEEGGTVEPDSPEALGAEGYSLGKHVHPDLDAKAFEDYYRKMPRDVKVINDPDGWVQIWIRIPKEKPAEPNEPPAEPGEPNVEPILETGGILGDPDIPGNVEDGEIFAEGGTVPEKQRVAYEILDQLGGYNKLRAMTGASNFASEPNSLSFRLKSPKANYVKITLNSMDTYDVEFGKMRGDSYKVVAEEKGIYDDMLKKTVEKNTGMYLTLFAKGGQTKAFYYHKHGTGLNGVHVGDTVTVKASEQNPEAREHTIHSISLNDDGKIHYVTTKNKAGSYFYHKLSDIEYAKGGKVKFSDKVKAITKKLEGSKVPAKYRKTEGKRFTKKTATKAAKNIAGSMRVKELMNKYK